MSFRTCGFSSLIDGDVLGVCDMLEVAEHCFGAEKCGFYVSNSIHQVSGA